MTKVKKTIDECEACQKTKVVTTQTKEKTKKLQAEELFEKIYIDICGPLKEVYNGNNRSI